MFFFAYEQLEKAFKSFSTFFELEDHQVDSKEEDQEDIQVRRSAINELNQQAEQEFNKKWNWLLLCKSVSEYLFEPFFTTMNRNLFEVLTIGTLLKEQVDILKNKNNG